MVEKKYFVMRKHNAEKRNDRMLQKMGEPLRWVGYKSKQFSLITLKYYEFIHLFHKDIVCEMDLLRTQKIRSLVDIHKEMKTYTNKEDRMATINKVFKILEAEPSSVKRNEVIIITILYVISKLFIEHIYRTQLIGLLKREIEMLPIKRSENLLETMRMRQSSILSELIKGYDRQLTTMAKGSNNK